MHCRSSRMPHGLLADCAGGFQRPQARHEALDVQHKEDRRFKQIQGGEQQNGRAEQRQGESGKQEDCGEQQDKAAQTCKQRQAPQQSTKKGAHCAHAQDVRSVN